MIKKYKYYGIISLAILFTIFLIWNNGRINSSHLLSKWSSEKDINNLSIIYPFDSSLFPPEISSPTFRWNDDYENNDLWILIISFPGSDNHFVTKTSEMTWKPDSEQWEEIKFQSLGTYSKITILGFNKKKRKQIVSGHQICFGVSTDSVMAQIFYREVPIPFAFARAHVDSIKWRMCDISSEEIAPVVMEKLPVCANCHSFTPDGKTIAMDVDALGIKSSYVTADFQEETVFSPDKFNYWSDFQNGIFTYGLLSQISPEGKFAVSTLNDHEIFVAKPDLEYSNFFFPIKGILVIYDLTTKEYWSLPGANDTMLIQSNANWTPDGKYLYFARGIAVHSETSGLLRGTAIMDSNKFNDFLQSYLDGSRGLQFDIYKIPFNNGKGGIAEPLLGASNNGMSNFFPRFSHDGKWVVFTKAKNFMLLQPDSRLYIMPAEGGKPREMNCNTSNMNSWHSWSPNGKWMVFSSKLFGPYTQLFLTHIDENGFDSPPILLENILPPQRAANIPEFVNIKPDKRIKIKDDFSADGNYNLLVRAYHLLTIGAIDESIETLNFAIKKDTLLADAYGLRGWAKLKDGDLKGSLVDYSKAIKLKPGSAKLYVDRGYARYTSGDYESAISDFDRAIKVDPALSKAFFNRGISNYELARYENANADYSKAISLVPEYKEAYMNRGVVKYKLRDYIGAIEDFTKTIILNPEEANAYLERANAKDESGAYESALLDYNKAIELEPDNYRAYFERGISYYLHDEFSKALTDFNKAVSLDYQNGEVLFRRGIVLFELGQKNEACKDWRKAELLGYKEAGKEIVKNCR